jgi:predicted nucleotidyltransferase
MDEPSHFQQDFRYLTELPLDKRLAACPGLLRDIAAVAAKDLTLIAIWLFGSRARGDARPLSDYDLAFDVADDEDTWLLFLARYREKVQTFLPIDWVYLPTCDTRMRAAILTEGIRLV